VTRNMLSFTLHKDGRALCIVEIPSLENPAGSAEAGLSGLLCFPAPKRRTALQVPSVGGPFAPKRVGAAQCGLSFSLLARRPSGSQLFCRSSAGPTPFHRGGPGPKPPRRSGMHHRLPADAMPLKTIAPKREPSLPSRAEARVGRPPLQAKSPLGGASPSLGLAASRPVAKGELSSSRNAPGRRLRSGGSLESVP
jgi:hypothetical protein